MRKGKIVSFTRLEVSPEGFDSPLLLCLVSTGKEKVLAYAKNEDVMKINKKVKLSKRGEHLMAESLSFRDYLPFKE